MMVLMYEGRSWYFGLVGVGVLLLAPLLPLAFIGRWYWWRLHRRPEVIVTSVPAPGDRVVISHVHHHDTDHAVDGKAATYVACTPLPIKDRSHVVWVDGADKAIAVYSVVLAGGHEPKC